VSKSVTAVAFQGECAPPRAPTLDARNPARQPAARGPGCRCFYHVGQPSCPELKHSVIAPAFHLRGSSCVLRPCVALSLRGMMVLQERAMKTRRQVLAATAAAMVVPKAAFSQAEPPK